MKLILTLVLASWAGPVAAQAPTDTEVVRHELTAWYAKNEAAFRAKDLAAIMRLRDPEFSTLGPDNVPMDYAAMERRTEAFLNGVDRWISLSFALDSIQVTGDLAQAMVRQHLLRMAKRPDGSVRQVETWATQREVWRYGTEGWRLYRVDEVHDQRRLIDGRPD